MKNKLRNKKGITLIALVITIIVLLILAGVAISMLSGENGILKQATNAKTQTEKRSEEETVKLAAMSALTKGLGTLDKGALKEELENIYGKGNVIVDSGTVIIGENEYIIGDNGEVIKKDNSPVIADEEETANWLYSTYDTGEDIETGEICLIGYSGEIPADGVLTIPGILTINGKQEKVVRIMGGVWGVKTDSNGMPTDERELYGYSGASSLSISNSKNVKKIVISSGITEIGYAAFSNGDSYQSGLINLESISIPASVTQIGLLAFESCANLKEVKLSYGCTNVCGFPGCSSLSNINIPSSVNEIQDLAFHSTALKSMDFSNITKIGAAAFCGSKLQEADISNVTTIGPEAFENCTELTKIILPDITISKESYIFGSEEELSSDKLTKLTHIEYKGNIYTSVDAFYDSL